MPFTLLDTQEVPATLSFTDVDGNAATLPTGVVPVWSSSDITIATVDASADPTGLTAVISAVNPVGVATITATTAVDPANPIVTSDTVTISASAATAGALGYGTPVNR
jgi:hypothetical protein